MPNWKKVIVSGSNAALNSLNVTTNVVAQSFTGSLLGTSSFANNATSASFAATASFAQNAANAFIQNGNSFGATALLGTNDAQDLQFETDGTVRMTISGSNGNVGIGTLTPQYNLDVVSNASKVRISSAGSSADLLLKGQLGAPGDHLGFYIYSQFANGYFTSTHENGEIIFGTGNQIERMRIKSGGNVGINDINPQYKLAVTGDANITANLTATGSIKFPSLANTNQTNVVGYDTTTGQLFYQTTSSLSVTTASYALTASHGASGFTIGISQIKTATVTSSTVGSNNLFTDATGSFSGAKYLYTVVNGANARTGEVMAVWNGGSVQFTDNSTLDIGSTTAVTASVSIVSAQAQFNIQTNTSGWTLKSTVTYI